MEDGARTPATRWLGRRLALSAALVAAALMVGLGWLLLRPGPEQAGPATPSSPLIGHPAPVLVGQTLAGGQLDLADLRGSVVLVTVWAAWCAPCRDELPVLVDSERRLGPRGLRLVGIDLRDGERQARDLLAQVGGDPAASIADPDGRLADAWQVAGVPQTFVVDAAGTVSASRLGAVTRDWVERAVTPLLTVRRPAAGGG